jgi:transposase
MARYKEYDYRQGKMIPISFDKQILPGTFEYTLNYLIDNELDLSVFDDRYSNDDAGAPAYDPAILLKIILYAYSRGIVSSRKIEQCCRENIIFMALSCDTSPHFTTIADFISTLDSEIINLFLEVLLVCDEMNLIGKEMFAIDGVKLPSNASKEWSGTREELSKKKEKMEKAVRQIMARHKETDEENLPVQEEKYISTLTENIRKIRTFLATHDNKLGTRGTPIKSNITDNESAKMKTSKGVIQGYDGVAMVDAKHQVIVHAEAHGAPQEQALLQPMIEGARENFRTLGDPDIFDATTLTADSGFHSEKNMEMLSLKNIDAYVADAQFRKRDPRFIQRDRYKERFKKEYAASHGTTTAFSVRQFTMAEDKSHCICPAGKRLYRNGGNIIMKGNKATKFRGNKGNCLACELRKKCLRYPDRTETRQVYFFEGRKESFTERMKEKIDSLSGRLIYSRRLATVEPVFANICSTLGLDRFTLRGKRKVNIQWLLYCTVHNLLKVHRYGYRYA